MAHSSDAASTISIQEFVKRLRPEPRTAFLSLRAIVVSLGPDIVERVTPSEVLYLRRERVFTKVEALRPTRLAVVFPIHVQPEDAMGRLLRRGEERYFRLEKPDDLDAHCQEFVRKAYTVSR